MGGDVTSLLCSHTCRGSWEGSRRRWRGEDKKKTNNKPLKRSVCTTACSHPFLLSLSSHQLVVLPFFGVASLTPGQNCKNASGNRDRKKNGRSSRFDAGAWKQQQDQENNLLSSSMEHFPGSFYTNMVLRSAKDRWKTWAWNILCWFFGELGQSVLEPHVKMLIKQLWPLPWLLIRSYVCTAPNTNS